MDLRGVITLALVVFVLFSSLADGTRSGNSRCKCNSVTHPQEFFCKSDYVFRGKMLSGPTPEVIPEPKTHKSTFRIWPTEREVLRYVFQVVEILKGRTQMGNGEEIIGKGKHNKNKSPFRVKIYTDPNICSARLTHKTKYLVSGYLDEGRMFISSCDWVVRWTILTRAQRVGLRLHYRQTKCECYTSSCGYLDPDGRLLDIYCSKKHLYCSRRGLGCDWKHVFSSHIPYNKCVLDKWFGGFFNFFKEPQIRNDVDVESHFT